jgi:hypothetical protein
VRLCTCVCVCGGGVRGEGGCWRWRRTDRPLLLRRQRPLHAGLPTHRHTRAAPRARAARTQDPRGAAGARGPGPRNLWDGGRAGGRAAGPPFWRW